MVRRGEVYDARLDPTEGSGQAGSRPVVIVSRDAINTASPVVYSNSHFGLIKPRGVGAWSTSRTTWSSARSRP
jgi:mRNA-degrading endonuclease toxin of MazEF toxin-antitoxin module